MARRIPATIISGFLGAGKTTSILRFADWLTARGLKVGLITNDQGAGLVDSAIGMPPPSQLSSPKEEAAVR